MTSYHSDVSFLRTWGAPPHGLQEQAAVAVVIPTVLRPSLARALTSVFAQEFGGRVQVLVGIDAPQGSMEVLEATCRLAPSHYTVQAFYPGYSTSVRHNGMWDSPAGGALRTILSYLANAPVIAYLDDDNWWGPRHLATLTRAIEPVDWAFSLRWFVHPATARPICIDQWESVGPGAGRFLQEFDGFVDPNCLMIKTKRCAPTFSWWPIPLPGDPRGAGSDRHVFDVLRRMGQWAGTGEPTAFYVIDPADAMHRERLQWIGNAYLEAEKPEVS